jgi:NADPH-dependent curcumin reductase CurA
MRKSSNRQTGGGGCNPALAAGLVILLLCGCASIHRVSGPEHSVTTTYPDGRVVTEKWSWKDDARSHEFFDRGSLSNLVVTQSNLMGWPGVASFSANGGTIDISSNAAPVIGATGTAVGNVVGAAAKAAGVP